MKIIRNIINIDEEKCIGCGQCILACAEGAIALVDGKAKVISEMYCDGLGACMGTCPSGALSIERREAQAFNEEAAEKHLASRENKYQDGMELKMASTMQKPKTLGCGCPGTMAEEIQPPSCPSSQGHKTRSHAGGTRFWPVKLRLMNPENPYLKGAVLVLSADCSGFAAQDFHSLFEENDKRVLLIACPKFEKSSDIIERLKNIFQIAEPRSLSILRMEVPCCNGLSVFAHEALKQSGQKIEVKDLILGRDGVLKQ